ncbi:hypothetical protein [Streptomyces typhae]|uniref:hypothetical protein n=1 Tax=Streptomyces typhae TaxID=2681492 RepID=UPI0018DF469E|nr:hypothetical protein [Streptomyces typhae]
MSEPTAAERVAALHAEGAADYAHAHDPDVQAAARDQLALARTHGNEQAGAQTGGGAQ